MSQKFTKSEIEKIISEEFIKIINEAKIDDLLKLAARAFAPGASKGPARVVRMNLVNALDKIEDMEPSKAKELLKILNANLGSFTADQKKLIDAGRAKLVKYIDDAEKAAKVAKGGDGVFRKLVAGTGLAALGLLMPKLSDMFKSAEAKDPDEEDVKKELEKLDPNKVIKAAESAKQKRTRIAHAAIKDNNPKNSVSKFQSRLEELGYDLGDYGIDGDYGGATLDAVREFQKKNNLDIIDGIVGKNTWNILSSDKAIPAFDMETLPDLPTSLDGSEAVAQMGSDLVSQLENIDPEKMQRVYERVSRGLEKALRNQGVPRRAANTTLRKFLPIISPDPFGNDVESVKNQKIMRLKNILNKGINVSMADKDISLGQEVIDEIEKALKQEGLMKESNLYDLRFNKWSKLWK